MSKIQETDKLDRQILSRLMKNAKRPYTDIAHELAVSGGTIHVRMKKLEDSGVVKGYLLEVDHEKLGFDVCAFLGIYLEKSSMYQDASEQLTQISEIVAAHYTTGLYNIFAKVICRDTNHLREVLNKIQNISGIQRTETFISLEESINRPIELVDDRDK